jgi:hypothetical protein
MRLILALAGSFLAGAFTMLAVVILERMCW